MATPLPPRPRPAATASPFGAGREMVHTQPKVAAPVWSIPFVGEMTFRPFFSRYWPHQVSDLAAFAAFAAFSSSAQVSSYNAAAPKAASRLASRNSSAPGPPDSALANPSRSGGRIQAAKYIARSMPMSAKRSDHNSNSRIWAALNSSSVIRWVSCRLRSFGSTGSPVRFDRARAARSRAWSSSSSSQYQPHPHWRLEGHPSPAARPRRRRPQRHRRRLQPARILGREARGAGAMGSRTAADLWAGGPQNEAGRLPPWIIALAVAAEPAAQR